jgi:hypothetical protein
VPCATWRSVNGAFELQRVNRAARERLGGDLGTPEDLAAAFAAAGEILGMPRERLLGDPRWWAALRMRFEDGTPVTPGEDGAPGRRALVEGVPERDVRALMTRPEGDVVVVSSTRRCGAAPAARSTAS